MASNQIIITDTNVLINLFHAERLDLVGNLPGWQFMVTREVIREITVEDQAAAIQAVVATGDLTIREIFEPSIIEHTAVLMERLGSGDAASIALTKHLDCWIASDDRGVFKQVVREELQPDRIITTAGLFVLAIRSRVLDVAEADRSKSLLEQHRFKLKFASFKDLL